MVSMLDQLLYRELVRLLNMVTGTVLAGVPQVLYACMMLSLAKEKTSADPGAVGPLGMPATELRGTGNTAQANAKDR
jgi:hypothetical protein